MRVSQFDTGRASMAVAAQPFTVEQSSSRGFGAESAEIEMIYRFTVQSLRAISRGQQGCRAGEDARRPVPACVLGCGRQLVQRVVSAVPIADAGCSFDEFDKGPVA